MGCVGRGGGRGDIGRGGGGGVSVSELAGVVMAAVAAKVATLRIDAAYRYEGGCCEAWGVERASEVHHCCACR